MTRRTRGAGGQLLESAFQHQVIGLARAYGWPFVYSPPQGGQGKASTGGRQIHHGQIPEGRGFPDLVLVKASRMIAAELKAEKGRLGPGQAEWLDAFRTFALSIDLNRRVGSTLPSLEVYLWRPSDFDEIHDALRGRQPRRVDL